MRQRVCAFFVFQSLFVTIETARAYDIASIIGTDLSRRSAIQANYPYGNGGNFCDPSNGFAYEICTLYYPFWFAAPSSWNYGNIYPDQSMQNQQIRIVASTALAGSIVSLQYKGYEFIDSGGHGASFQYAAHFYKNDDASDQTECQNPTEAGSRTDDAGQSYPYHLQSSSAIISPAWGGWGFGSSNSTGIIWSQSNMANYENPSTANPRCVVPTGTTIPTNTILSKAVNLGGFFNNEFLPNVLIFRAWVNPNKSYDRFQIRLIAYLTSFMTQSYDYDAQNNILLPVGSGSSTGTHARINSDAATGRAIGVIEGSPLSSKEYSTPMWNRTGVDPASRANFRVLAADRRFRNVVTSESLTDYTFFAVGSVGEVETQLSKICKAIGSCL